MSLVKSGRNIKILGMMNTGFKFIYIRESYENRRNLLEQQAIGINFTKFNEEDLSNNNFVFIINDNNNKEIPCYTSISSN